MTNGAMTGAGLDRMQVMNHLLKLTNRLMAPFSAHLEKRYTISLNEFRALMLIGQLGTTASHELAQILGVNTMAVSRAVAALNKHGRITVETDPASRRRKTLRLTPAGEALCSEEMAAFDRYLSKLTDHLEEQDLRGRSLFIERTRPGKE